MTAASPFDLVIFDCDGVLVDVRDILDELGSHRIATCVESQSPRTRLELALSATGLARYFGDRVFTASMVPRGRPYPDLFLYAAARTGHVPERCAVIEDSASGVRAAVAAGMRVFGCAADEDAGELARAGATTFRTMRELPALLAGGPAKNVENRLGIGVANDPVACVREA